LEIAIHLYHPGRIWLVFTIHPPTGLGRRLAVLTLATTLTATAVPIASLAQSDGTDADISSVATDCMIYRADTLPVEQVATPSLPVDGEPIAPSPSATPVASPVVPGASPVASPVPDDRATPVTTLAASPAASPVADATPADPNAQVADDLGNVTATLLNCFNDRDFSTFAQLTSDAARGEMFGSDDPLTAEVFIGLANTLPEDTRELVSVNDVSRIDETSVSTVVTYTVASQLRTENWTFVHQRVDGLPTWVLDSIAPGEVDAPEGAATIDVTIANGAYDLEPATVSGPDVVLNVENTDQDAVHETLVLQLADGVTTDALLQSTGGSLPEGVTLIGQASFAPGGSGQVVLVDIEPGTYTIVDLLPDADGLPNLSGGMEASFTVS
jgi:hypothetical protein